jgi:hypothetical protein
MTIETKSCPSRQSPPRDPHPNVRKLKNRHMTKHHNNINMSAGLVLARAIWGRNMKVSGTWHF